MIIGWSISSNSNVHFLWKKDSSMLRWKNPLICWQFPDKFRIYKKRKAEKMNYFIYGVGREIYWFVYQFVQVNKNWKMIIVLVNLLIFFPFAMVVDGSVFSYTLYRYTSHWYTYIEMPIAATSAVQHCRNLS